LAYGNENIAPNIGELFNGIADYMAIRNVLLAHATVYRLYKNKYFAEQQGKKKYLFRRDALIVLDNMTYYFN